MAERCDDGYSNGLRCVLHKHHDGDHEYHGGVHYDEQIPSTPDRRANERQIGGDHYTKYGDLQPWDLWLLWNLNGFQATIIKHIVRYRDKLGIEDLEKARHYLDKLIEEERCRLKRNPLE